MQDILYLVHRIPYPPNKGDKVRSYHILQHLVQRYRVHLGTFIDQPQDWEHVDALKKICASVHVLPLSGWQGKARCMSGLLRGAPLSVAYYRDAAMQRWVNHTLQAHAIRHAVVFSAAMQQFVDGKALDVVLDLVDVDSAKWERYTKDHRFPLSWIYRREARTLLAYENASACNSLATLLSTPAEVALLAERAPACQPKLHSMQNGVNTAFFSPDPQRTSPYPTAHPVLVFTGAMDYWPNVDAVSWFVNELFPKIRVEIPELALYIVGSNPSPAVRQLADGQHTFVTGSVPDIRPYLQHATLAVVPIRIARGIQNKVLEAMAMGQSVVVTAECARALGAPETVPLRTACDANEFIQHTLALLRQAETRQTLGQQARDFVQNQYSWPKQLQILDTLLAAQDSP